MRWSALLLFSCAAQLTPADYADLASYEAKIQACEQKGREAKSYDVYHQCLVEHGLVDAGIDGGN